jgi:nitrite reductase/ring-hydroxylating ferredoxin subunit
MFSQIPTDALPFSGSGGASDKAAMSTRIRLCATADVAPDTPLKVETNGLTLAVFNVDGEFHVTDDACTHGPGSLSEGFVECGVVECNFHQGKFDIRTGKVVEPPCVIPVKTYKTVVEGGDVYIEV